MRFINSGALVNAKDKNTADKIFKDLDQDASGYVNFKEFITMVKAVTAVTTEILE